MATCGMSTVFRVRIKRYLLMAWLLFGLISPVIAAEAVAPQTLPQAQAALTRLEQRMASPQKVAAPELKSIKQELALVRSFALDCVQEATPKIQRLDSELSVLQPQEPDKTESKTAEQAQAVAPPTQPIAPALSRQLQDLQSRKSSLEERVASCRLMVLHSDNLDSDADDYLRSLHARKLLARDPNLVGVLQANVDERQRWGDFFERPLATLKDWKAVSPAKLAGAAVAGLLGLILGLTFWRRYLTRWASFKVAPNDVSAGLAQAFLVTAAGYAPILLALGSALAYVALIPRTGGDLPVVFILLCALLFYFAIAAFINALLNPSPPAAPYLPLPSEIAIPLSRRSRLLAVVALARWLVLELHANGLLDDTMYSLARQVIGWVWVLNVIWVIWLLRRLESWHKKWTIPFLICTTLLGGVFAAGIGYINLGALIVVGTTYSMGLIGLALVLTQFFSDFFDGLDQGRYDWQKAVRRAIGLKDQDYLPGLAWSRLLVNLVLWMGTVLMLLHVWNTDEDITADIVDYFTQGFQVAGLTIVPLHLLLAILILALMLTLIAWIKGRLSSKWLVNSHMEPNAQQALVASFGYVAAAIAILVALTFAGISLTHLTIVAGALSVGLGFGLQNIVNNFVSGIIMLVERPVRHGDWIVVGSTEGLVERISIRTTTIRTFDRADVIVPNSDMISSQVTNWTLGNTWGRIKIPIGVGYSSDVETVISTLLAVANNHPDVVKGNPKLSDPYALFLEFGDSSLNFELRVHIGDINRCMHVISDLNRAINTEFNKQGIEIPYPQRDVHFRNSVQVDGGSKVVPDVSGGGASIEEKANLKNPP
jgi:small-conductance mechanosensitive channel